MVKLVFNEASNWYQKGDSSELSHAFLKMKEEWWNQFHRAHPSIIRLTKVIDDLGYSLSSIRMEDPDLADQIERGYWEENPDSDSRIDFGITFNEDGYFVLNFNCELSEKKPEKKRCYFWKIYKYTVPIEQITLKGWIQWCTELYEIQHGKPRPEGQRLFLNPGMESVSVKARFWNWKRIENWLKDHGYVWTQTVETKFQYPVENPDEVIFVDSDAELANRNKREPA